MSVMMDTWLTMHRKTYWKKVGTWRPNLKETTKCRESGAWTIWRFWNCLMVLQKCMTIARDKLVQHEQHLMFHCQTNFWNTALICWLATFVFTISNQENGRICYWSISSLLKFTRHIPESLPVLMGRWGSSRAGRNPAPLVRHTTSLS